MKKIITIALVLALFLGITGVSFAQIMFGPSSGFYRSSDEFIGEDFGRVQYGITLLNFDFSYYLKNIPIGVYSKLSIGGMLSGYEWKDNDKITGFPYDSSFTDIIFSIGPSYKFKLGKIVDLPVSLGPSFRFTSDSTYNYDNDDYYESINLGVMGDVSLLIYPIEWVYLRLGISGDYNFYRSEQGTMVMEYRQKINTKYSNVDYNAFILSAYMGVGFRFD